MKAPNMRGRRFSMAAVRDISVCPTALRASAGHRPVGVREIRSGSGKSMLQRVYVKVTKTVTA